MTEEEIRPIAENYVEEYCHCSDGEYTDGSLVCAGIGTALIVSRQLEKRIAELEEAKANLEYLLEGRDNEIDELKKENKVLAQNLEDTEILNNTYEKRFDDLKKENAELKEENKKWKDEWQEQVQKATDEGYARTLQTIQLTRAKEIIKNLLILKNDHYGNTKMEWRVKVTEQAEQFLNSEVEK